MSYRLEIAFNINQSKNVNKIKQKLINNACKHGCENYWIDVEMNGHGRTINRNHIIIILMFPENANNIIRFINYVKTNRNIYIESIGFDDIKYTLIYASKLYLNMMDKKLANEYITKKKQCSNLVFQRIINAV
tara:strand:+ start:199 stop:597 length:399 start_codon:yes stop_codon:yes gene_type:complete